MTEQDIINLGFRKQSDGTFSHLVNSRRLSPFRIKAEPAKVNNTEWRILKDGVLISVVETQQQYKMVLAILSLSFQGE